MNGRATHDGREQGRQLAEPSELMPHLDHRRPWTSPVGAGLSSVIGRRGVYCSRALWAARWARMGVQSERSSNMAELVLGRLGRRVWWVLRSARRAPIVKSLETEDFVQVTFWKDTRFWAASAGAERHAESVRFDRLQPVRDFGQHAGVRVEGAGRFVVEEGGQTHIVSLATAATKLGVGEPHLRFWVVRYQMLRALVGRSATGSSERGAPSHPGVNGASPVPHAPPQHVDWLRWQIVEMQEPGWWHGD